MLLAALLGCGENPFAPPYSGPQPTLDLSVWLIDAGDTIPVHVTADGRVTDAGQLAPAPGLLVASGVFWPGEVKGRLRRITSDRLRVNGLEALGTKQRDGSLRYLIQTPLTRATSALTIDVPLVDGVHLVQAVLHVGLATRVPNEVPVIADGVLRVPVTTPSAVEPAPWSRAWTLGLRRSATEWTRFDGTTTLPPTLVVPVATVLPGNGPIDVRLSDVVRLFTPTERSSDSTYALSARITSTLRWPAVTPQPAP